MRATLRHAYSATILSTSASLLLSFLGPASPGGATAGSGSEAADRSARRADLAVTSVAQVPPRAAPGDPITTRAVVTNLGSARGEATPLRLLLSHDGRASAEDLFAGAGRVPALAPGARATRTLTGNVPTAAHGRYRVLVCLAPKKPPRDKAERRNDCEYRSTDTVFIEPDPALPWATAQITGELELRQSGHTVSSGRDRTWDRYGDIQLALDVVAPNRRPDEAEFTDAGSHYSWAGSDTYVDGGEACTFWWEENEAGGGPLVDDRVSARFMPGTGENSIEITLTMAYHVDGRSGADCREDHTWADDRVNTTVLVFDLKAKDEEQGVLHYVSPVRPPAGSLWDTVSATLDLEFQRQPI